jgi:hypothetical protein
MITATWTDHEDFLAETCASRLKLTRLDHLQAIWALAPCGPIPFDLKEALSRLAWAIDAYTVNLHPPINPLCPVVTFRAEDHIPEDFRPHSELLRTRWKKPAVPTTVFVASKAATNLFGATSGGLPPIDHRDHDALLADAFVHHLRSDPDTIHQWVGEQMRSKAGYRIKDPDAFMIKPDGTPYQIIESGGAYSASQIGSLCHFAFVERDCFELLEIW